MGDINFNDIFDLTQHEIFQYIKVKMLMDFLHSFFLFQSLQSSVYFARKVSPFGRGAFQVFRATSGRGCLLTTQLRPRHLAVFLHCPAPRLSRVFQAAQPFLPASAFLLLQDLLVPGRMLSLRLFTVQCLLPL